MLCLRVRFVYCYLEELLLLRILEDQVEIISVLIYDVF